MTKFEVKVYPENHPESELTCGGLEFLRETTEKLLEGAEKPVPSYSKMLCENGYWKIIFNDLYSVIWFVSTFKDFTVQNEKLEFYFVH